MLCGGVVGRYMDYQLVSTWAKWAFAISRLLNMDFDVDGVAGMTH